MISNFKFTWPSDGKLLINFEIPIEFPLPCSVIDLWAQIVATQKVPVFAIDNLKDELTKFVTKESDNYDAQISDEILASISDDNIDDLAQYWAREFSQNHKDYAPPQTVSDDDIFVDSFKNLFSHCGTISQSGTLMKSLLHTEKQFASNLQKLIRARDWEVERMRREHATEIDKVIQTNVVHEQVNKIAAEHFETFNMIEANYASQIICLSNQQKSQYRQMVIEMNNRILIDEEIENNEISLSPIPAEINELFENRLTESFTIHLGAQLKTMHNLRLTTMNPMEFCKFGSSGFDDSERLHMLLSLYSDSMLHGLVLLVDSRPLYHINLRTEFSRACEQSTELHFDCLESQLQTVEMDLLRANQYRSTNIIKVHDFDNSATQHVTMESFSCGDVYITRHSNLLKVHTVFHLVSRDDLKNQDINSRHPCINGLRNIVKLCYQYGITTINLPLLLVNQINEDQTNNWCLKRAELIFKCVKGFMMECASANDKRQFTVQFFLPTDLSKDLFGQLSQLLTQIFHIPTPLMAKNM